MHDMAQLAKLKPSAKCELILVNGKTIKAVWFAKLGKHTVKLQDGPEHYDNEDAALAAAVEFRRQVRETVKAQPETIGTMPPQAGV